MKTITYVQAKITDEKHAAPEGVWVRGGGIEVPCKFYEYGQKENKFRVRREIRATEIFCHKSQVLRAKRCLACIAPETSPTYEVANLSNIKS